MVQAPGALGVHAPVCAVTPALIGAIQPYVSENPRHRLDKLYPALRSQGLGKYRLRPGGNNKAPLAASFQIELEPVRRDTIISSRSAASPKPFGWTTAPSKMLDDL